MISTRRATVADLAQVKGKAELVNGELVVMSPTGGLPGRASLKIGMSLARHEQEHGGGVVLPDNVGFIVDLPNRESFSPDVAWHAGPVGMGFVQGAPAFAVEVRSEKDYGAAADRRVAAKIADYFAAGTLVVWDVDLLGQDVVKKYVPGGAAKVFRRGEVADAEPAVTGWRFEVDQLFK